MINVRGNNKAATAVTDEPVNAREGTGGCDTVNREGTEGYEFSGHA
jgi:hypothetical protein